MGVTILSPLKRPSFRLLWLGMSLSYAGDRLQELAQGWLVATLTSSALAVGGIGVLSSIGMLLMPFGGVIADQADRRRILILGQRAGAVMTGLMAVLAFTDRITVRMAWVAPGFSAQFPHLPGGDLLPGPSTRADPAGR